MPLVDESRARELIQGQRVAVVCNAPEILHQSFGRLIDEHDLVLRMNRALPRHSLQKAIGARTDILTGGIVHPLEMRHQGIPWYFWFKHTQLGGRHLDDLVANLPDAKVFHVPMTILKPLYDEFGCGASSGPAAVETCRQLGAASVSVFGASCWGELEPGTDRHWWTYPAAFSALAKVPLVHNAYREADWMRRNTREVTFLHREVNL